MTPDLSHTITNLLAAAHSLSHPTTLSSATAPRLAPSRPPSLSVRITSGLSQLISIGGPSAAGTHTVGHTKAHKGTQSYFYYSFTTLTSTFTGGVLRAVVGSLAEGKRMALQVRGTVVLLYQHADISPKAACVLSPHVKNEGVWDMFVYVKYGTCELWYLCVKVCHEHAYIIF